jgi:tetratricopeptide (TPR) repeat protein
LLGNQQVTAAKELVEDIITADNTGEPLDVSSRKQFHIQFWERAAAAYERSEFAEALTWYNYSLSLFPESSVSPGDKNLGKLQRNRCSCLMSLDQLDKAADAISQAISCDPDSPYGQFLLFKVAVLRSQDDEAKQALQQMVECGGQEKETVTGLVCLAAQMAFEKSHRVLATAALEQLIQMSSNCRQIFTALRCLIRLKLTFLNEAPEKLGPLHSLISYIESAERRLAQPVERNRDEADWFMKMAWNLALQCGDNYREMGDLFSACYKLSQYLVTDQAVLVRRKTCQLMAAAARLHQARETTDLQDKV